MRCRRQELDAHPDSLASTFTRKHDSAFLLILRQRIHEDNRLPLIHFVSQQEQATVCVYHQRFAHFAEFPPVVPAPLCLEPHFVKDALASARRGKGRVIHVLMMRFARKPVNCP